MTAVCRSVIFHPRNISRIRRYLTAAATEQVVHAFVKSRLDIGNALLYRLPLKQMQRLQKIQNWVARLIDGAMRYSHATPLLKKLHWQPILVRVEFKTLLLTHRALNGQAPEYIEQRVSRPGAPANTVYCVRHAQGVTGVTERGSPKSMDCTTTASDIVIYDHCCIKSKIKDSSLYHLL